MFYELYLQVKIRTWAFPRRLHWSSCGARAMGQQFLSSRMGVGKMVIIWLTGKAWVNGSRKVPIRTSQMYLDPDQNNYGNLCIASTGIRSVPFLPTGIAGNFCCDTPSICFFLHNQAVFIFSSILWVCFFPPAAKNISLPCLTNKSLCLFVGILIILSSLIQ